MATLANEYTRPSMWVEWWKSPMGWQECTHRGEENGGGDGTEASDRAQVLTHLCHLAQEARWNPCAINIVTVAHTSLCRPRAGRGGVA